MPISELQLLANLLHSAHQEKSYTLLLGSGLSLTPALLSAKGFAYWEDFYDFIKPLSEVERTHFLRPHLDALPLREGYKYLTQIIQEGYFKAVFTTNIDPFLENALNEAGLESIDVYVYRGDTNTEKELVNSLQNPSATRNPVYILHGNISHHYMVALSEIMKFPESLEVALKNYFAGDMLVLGLTRRSDLDIWECIPTKGGSIWYISPEGNPPLELPANRYKNKVISGNDADFNDFFRTLLEALHAQQKEDGKNYQHAQVDLALDQQGTKERRDFFVSYNKQDHKWGEWIAWQLEQAGFSVFFDGWDLSPGTNIGIHVQRATSMSRRTIAVLSKNYLEAPLMQAEWSAAFVQDPTSKQRTLLPVHVDKCELPGLWKALTPIDLVGVDEAEARKLLMQGVETKRNKPAVPPSFPGQAQAAPKALSAMDDNLGLPEHPSYPHV